MAGKPRTNPDGTPRKPKVEVKPRACFIPYSVGEDGSVTFGEATRKAEDLLATIDENPGMKYHRFFVK